MSATDPPSSTPLVAKKALLAAKEADAAGKRLIQVLAATEPARPAFVQTPIEPSISSTVRHTTPLLTGTKRPTMAVLDSEPDARRRVAPCSARLGITDGHLRSAEGSAHDPIVLDE